MRIVGPKTGGTRPCDTWVFLLRAIEIMLRKRGRHRKELKNIGDRNAPFGPD